jgi:peroxiredoxin
MTIAIGDRLPDATFNVLKDGVQAVNTQDVFGGRKVALFAVPGYIEQLGAFQAKGIAVACLSVNDAFVMGAWAKQAGVPDGIEMLADGNGAFAKAMGLELDATAFGMGLRSKRFALYAEDGVVKALFVEAPGEFKVSSAEHLLANLPG